MTKKQERIYTEDCFGRYYDIQIGSCKKCELVVECKERFIVKGRRRIKREVLIDLLRKAINFGREGGGIEMGLQDYKINFAGRTETLEQILGSEPVSPPEMNKKLWAFIKANSLSKNEGKKKV